MELWHESVGEGPPILLLHAGICDARMWNREMSGFAEASRVIRCDLRGFGRTPLPAEPFSHANDVIELLETLGPERTTLVGVSMGGLVALDVALARPDLVARLVIVGAPLPDHRWSEETESYWEEEHELIDAGDVEAVTELNLRFWVDGPHRSPEDVDPDVRGRIGAMQRRSLEVQIPVGEAAEDDLLATDLADRLGEITAPALVVAGELDVPDIHAIAERLVAELPNARGAKIEGAAHVPSMERPNEFEELVLGYLADIETPPRTAPDS